MDATARRCARSSIPAGSRLPADGAPSNSIRQVALAGWLIIGLFFGGIGAWAMTAPLNGAVVGNAVIKVDGNRKSVQHLDGGIVKDLRVKEGDKVKLGDVLIVLDETQARAEYDVLSQQYMVLRATEVRLLTELDHGTPLVIPEDLKARRRTAISESVWNGQVNQFESRRAAIEGQRNVIREKINQLGSQIVGAQAQVKSFTDQISSIQRRSQGHRAVGRAGPDRPSAHHATGADRIWAGRPDRGRECQYRQGPPGDRRAAAADRPARQ